MYASSERRETPCQCVSGVRSKTSASVGHIRSVHVNHVTQMSFALGTFVLEQVTGSGLFSFDFIAAENAKTFLSTRVGLVLHTCPSS